MADKPKYCYESGCPLAKIGRGFALGCGDQSSPIAIMFERPADDEINYTFGGPRPPEIPYETWQKILQWQREEYERRRVAFPELDNDEERKFLLRGAPVRGASGAEIRQWVLPMVGGSKEGLEGLFLENVLHCAAKHASGKGSYPTGEERDAAEACCSHWNRLGVDSKTTAAQRSLQRQNGYAGVQFIPTSAIVSLHPAGLLRETGGGIVALPLQQDTFSRARSFALKFNQKVLILAGGKAAKFWLGYADAVTRWCGHYTKESKVTWQRRMQRISEGLETLKKLLLPKPAKKTKRTTTRKTIMTSPTGRGKVEITDTFMTTESIEPKSKKSSSDSQPKKVRKPRKKKDPIKGMEAFGI